MFEPTLDCNQHTLVSHIAVLHHSSALLVKYRPAPDGQQGWFLPNDGLNHLEHPENAAKRVLKEQVGIEDSTLKLVEVESFSGDNGTWHLIFDYLSFPRTMKVSTGPMISEAKWFEIDKLPSSQEFAHQGWGKSILAKHAVAKIQPTASAK
jgi:ADP-ribose pyrophosphatase YjhB (NUDIX family)